MNNAHCIEPELLQPTPRPLLHRKGGRQHHLAAWVMALSLLAIGCVSARTAYFTAQAKYYGATVPATITKHSTRHTRNQTRYYLHYRYVWRGREYFDDESTYRDDFESFRVGDPIQVRLWSKRPDRDTYLLYPDGRDTSSIVGLVLGTLLIPMVGVSPLLLNISEARRQRHLLQNGVAVLARVIKVQSVGFKPSVTYEFQVGEKTQSNSSFVPRNQTQQFWDDQTLTALYDSKHPRHSMLYAMRDFNVAPHT